MGNKLSVGLSASALVVAVFGSTSAGRAALDAVVPVPLAKRAYLADTAKNSLKVSNIKASRTPTAGMLVPLGPDGKLPESVGAVGPKGDKGEKGDKGNPGAVAWASVNPNGTLIAGTAVGVTGVTVQTTGQYQVAYNRKTTGCTDLVSASQAGWIGTAHGTNDVYSTALIRTTAGAPANAAFRVALFCPS